MIVYPAIDLIDGKVVRLIEGDFQQETVYAQDPFAIVKKYADQGAEFMHLVDLSGAKDSHKRQISLIAKILKTSSLKIQVGGGLRTFEDIQELINAGADRVVLGSVVVKNPELAHKALDFFGPQKITFALDVRIENQSAIVRTQGWTETSGLTLEEIASPFVKKGLQRILCTDIAVDGRPLGPNVNLYKNLCTTFPQLQIQASGGVDTLEDLQNLKKSGAHSVVIGRALLTEKLSLSEALVYAQ
ncbi:MAG: 1-(5-phosphoribosyl)-5-[(5-phosphoribosylamino)methylideneamino]imidazole-4-carboxamide isomerase [Bdellovibrionaceae bacterium]|nr:1-(5-phosphoribosyl)-5-[(5-phosphoribosylamino)methylideneamino]imidazole-4-carboxamide isomerase [Pseudobdellovibrionaceae bacterium]